MAKGTKKTGPAGTLAIALRCAHVATQRLERESVESVAAEWRECLGWVAKARGANPAQEINTTPLPKTATESRDALVAYAQAMLATALEMSAQSNATGDTVRAIEEAQRSSVAAWKRECQRVATQPSPEPTQAPEAPAAPPKATRQLALFEIAPPLAFAPDVSVAALPGWYAETVASIDRARNVAALTAIWRNVREVRGGDVLQLGRAIRLRALVLLAREHERGVLHVPPTEALESLAAADQLPRGAYGGQS